MLLPCQFRPVAIVWCDRYNRVFHKPPRDTNSCFGFTRNYKQKDFEANVKHFVRLWSQLSWGYYPCKSEVRWFAANERIGEYMSHLKLYPSTVVYELNLMQVVTDLLANCKQRGLRKCRDDLGLPLACTWWKWHWSRGWMNILIGKAIFNR